MSLYDDGNERERISKFVKTACIILAGIILAITAGLFIADVSRKSAEEKARLEKQAYLEQEARERAQKESVETWKNCTRIPGNAKTPIVAEPREESGCYKLSPSQHAEITADECFYIRWIGHERSIDCPEIEIQRGTTERPVGNPSFRIMSASEKPVIVKINSENL